MPVADIVAVQPFVVVPAVQWLITFGQASHWSGAPLPFVSHCVPAASSHTLPTPSLSQSA